MRKSFLGYYRPSEAEFRKLWGKCLFVPDANVLLNLYRYSEDTRAKLIEILQRLESRLWVPHQAALEYQRNRLEVISAQREAYKEIEHLLVDTLNKLGTQLKTYKRHPLINTDQLLTSIRSAFEAQATMLQQARQKHPDLLRADEVREALTNLLDGKVGPAYSESRLREISQEGAQRYSRSAPPGYKDSKSKDGDRAFGDLILWFQIIDKATKDKVPIIIITDDVKEDWWWRHEGKIVGPHPELVEEIRTKANVDFYMYVSDQFMEYARQFLKQDVDQGAIDEIREFRRQQEVRRNEVERFLVEQEHRLHKLEHDRLAVGANVERLEAEIASVSRQLSDIRSSPKEGRDSLAVQELTGTLVRRESELEEQISFLESKRRSIAHHLDDIRARRNMLIHYDLPLEEARHGVRRARQRMLAEQMRIQEEIEREKP
jgi:PIN like domain/JAKMIP CC3 domain